MHTEVSGNAGSFKSSIEGGLGAGGIGERIQHTLGKLFTTFQVDDPGRFIIECVGKQKYFKTGMVGVGVDTRLGKINLAERFNIDAQCGHHITSKGNGGGNHREQRPPP